MKLANQIVVIVDCQTNGSSPAKSQMIELGWSVCSAASETAEIRTSLVALNEDQTVHKRILALTGISATELADAPAEQSVLSDFIDSLPKEAVFVAHYARFEQMFLQPHLPEIANKPILCTYEIARRLFPDLPSRSIRAVSGYLGHHIDETKRSSHHIEATTFIWRKLVNTLEKEGISDLTTLQSWLEVPPEISPAKATKKRYAISSEARLSLPDKPGVYKMLGHDGRILYVGKATSLKSRVNSYFRGRKTKGSRLNELVSQIASIDFHVTCCPTEAALVEADAIKSESPPYNRAQKVGNRMIGFSDLSLVPQEKPSLRGFGPFSSAEFVEHIHQIRSAIELLESPGSTPQMTEIDLLRSWELDVDQSVLLAGIDLFRKTYAAYRGGRIDWRRTLCKSWTESIWRARERRRLQQEELDVDEAEDDDIEVENSEEIEWHPEDVASYIAKSLSGYARRIHRSRWLNALADCELRWADQDSGQLLAIHTQRGRCSFKSLSDLDEPLKTEEKRGAKFLIADLQTYDRMQVLHTELRRLLKEERYVTMYIGTDRRLSHEQIKRYVFPGDFDEKD